MGRAKIGVMAGVILSMAALGSVSKVAHAQDAEGQQVSVSYVRVESEAPADLDRKIRALRWGVGVSTAAIPIGMASFLGGGAACSVNGIFVDKGCSTGQSAAIGIGIGLMVAGTAGMIASAILLRRRKQERKDLYAARRLNWSHASGSFVF